MNKGRNQLLVVLRLYAICLLVPLVAAAAGAQSPAAPAQDNRSDLNRGLTGKAEFRIFDLLAQDRPARRIGFSLRPPSWHANTSASHLRLTAPAALPAVHGTGTVGRLTLWVDTSPSGNSILGDSLITQANGNIGIGTDTPASKLTVQGMIETTLGGLKFPDGTVQTTAAVSGLQAVLHDATLQGDGTSAAPLGVAVPLRLTGPVSGTNPGVIQVRNTAFAGEGVFAEGGQAGNGVDAFGGGGGDVFGGGTGVFAQGGSTAAIRKAGTGVRAIGGRAFASGGVGGEGLVAEGGFPGGEGVLAFGGSSSDFGGRGGLGLSAVGGNAFQGAPGDGLHAEGGNSGIGFGGVGVQAKGGNSNELVGGIGVRAEGGESGNTFGGIGLHTIGGLGTGAGHQGGMGLFAQGGPGQVGATMGPAAQFNGNVEINGNLSKSSGSFKIDHPLDPENKFLYHSFVESPDMMNIYNGNITTDENGDATVTLPDYFEALNRDFRYQLTVIGQFAQAIVSQEIKDSHFGIKTNAPNVKVSWQVTGVRQDAYANKNRIPVEVNKTEQERGFYLHPEVFNQPEERGLVWARHPELMQQLKQQRLEAEQRQKQEKR